MRIAKKTGKQKAYHYGIIAEWISMLLLTGKGYRLIAWRYKTPAGEIDIIAKRGKYLVFVEVKARKNHLYLYEAVSATQQDRIQNAAHYFIRLHPRYARCTARFDLMMVHRLKPKHVAQAW